MASSYSLAALLFVAYLHPPLVPGWLTSREASPGLLCPLALVGLASERNLPRETGGWRWREQSWYSFPLFPCSFFEICLHPSVATAPVQSPVFQGSSLEEVPITWSLPLLLPPLRWWRLPTAGLWGLHPALLGSLILLTSLNSLRANATSLPSVSHGAPDWLREGMNTNPLPPPLIQPKGLQLGKSPDSRARHCGDPERETKAGGPRGRGQPCRRGPPNTVVCASVY